MDAATSRSFWDRILLAVLGIVTVYSLALVAVGLSLGDTIFDWLGFGPDDGDITGKRPRDYLRLVYGILGSVIVGWMLTIGAIVNGPLRRRERWAWNAVAAGTGTWFVLDTGLSLFLGYVGHAGFNIAFAVALAVPMVAIKNDLGTAVSRR